MKDDIFTCGSIKKQKIQNGRSAVTSYCWPTGLHSQNSSQGRQVCLGPSDWPAHLPVCCRAEMQRGRRLFYHHANELTSQFGEQLECLCSAWKEQKEELMARFLLKVITSLFLHPENMKEQFLWFRVNNLKLFYDSSLFEPRQSAVKLFINCRGFSFLWQEISGIKVIQE